MRRVIPKDESCWIAPMSSGVSRATWTMVPGWPGGSSHLQENGEAEEGGEHDGAGELAEGVDALHGHRLPHLEVQRAIEQGAEFPLEDGLGSHGLDLLGCLQRSADKRGEREVLLLHGSGIRLEEFPHAVHDPG